MEKLPPFLGEKMYYRLIKPNWAKEFIKNTGEVNPEFVREIEGPDVIEENDLYEDYIKRKNEEGYNVYYFPNCPSKKIDGHIQGKDIDCWNYVFVDMDLKDGVYKTKEEFIEKLKAFPLKPTFAIDSGNGIHAYWAINDLTRDAYISTQFRLIEHFKTDDSIWKLCQLMRLPGTKNTKKANKFVDVLDLPEVSSDQAYTLKELHEHLPPENGANAFKIKTHLEKADGIYEHGFSDVNFDEVPAKFKKLLEEDEHINKLFFDPKGVTGDRSKADMSLANKLCKLNFNKKETFQVIVNGEKARGYQGNKEDYAGSIVDKVYATQRNLEVAMNVGELLKTDLGAEGERIYGPKVWDRTKEGWRLGECMGLIAGTGIGKTALSLYAIHEVIKNSENAKDLVHFFFSLEMPSRQIIKRWRKLCKDDVECFKKLYVIDNRRKDRRIGWQEIYKTVTDTCKMNNTRPGIIVIDHMRALSSRIDSQGTPNFDVAKSMETGWGSRFLNATDQHMCRIMDDVAEMLNCFLIVQNQSSKTTSEEGDIPMGVNSAFGTSYFGFHCDYIMTVWQPLKRIQNQTRMKVTGWKYCKIREQDSEDGVEIDTKHVLLFDQQTGGLRKFTPEELEDFRKWNKIAIKVRHMEKRGDIPDDQYVEDTVQDVKLKLALKRFSGPENE